MPTIDDANMLIIQSLERWRDCAERYVAMIDEGVLPQMSIADRRDLGRLGRECGRVCRQWCELGPAEAVAVRDATDYMLNHWIAVPSHDEAHLNVMRGVAPVSEAIYSILTSIKAIGTVEERAIAALQAAGHRLCADEIAQMTGDKKRTIGARLGERIKRLGMASDIDSNQDGYLYREK